ncbi:family 1 encapsulin nanocompartment shell protein [Phytohabitans sp. ZYX-F-186]|uniref:Type 1 encapsulin shell protein n=1 Tax=Phytohabitans maris TaxID=3071409 RepID=A0ABU0ZMV0_9ACTN|nr:family 1 encapsulin nanocompartment shell protein [Phytohabitans sp. ZYX-F-186]MDQ7908351.1 family 1 encapsulin nanocompartment shell protein [Phytohabitans sp. ZYX-F-186]
MDNLHRELAPISAAAWASLEEEARRTFLRHLAGRHLVDVAGPAGPELAAVGTGHTRAVEAPAEGVAARARQTQPLVELRVPFTLDREQIDAVERGAKDPDWGPAKDAARRIALAEDRAVFHGYPAAAITGIAPASSNPPIALPAGVRDYPGAVARAVSALRLAGVDGPYRLALGADAYTAVTEAVDGGYPIEEHVARLVDGDVVWAPAITGGVLLSTRGGDFELHLGQDLAIGYRTHDATTVELYFQETFTFLAYTAEAAVALPAA